jgi:hypothetical protein
MGYFEGRILRVGTRNAAFFFLAAALTVFSIAQSVFAGYAIVTNSTGSVRDSFTENDTVYYFASNITNGSQTVRIFIVTNYDVWPNGSALNDVSTGYREVATDVNGDLPVTAVWTNPTAGSYDLVVDTNLDSLFNHSIDYIDNVSTAGFAVNGTQKPTLDASLGKSSPGDHDWDLGNDTGHTVMLQLNLTAEGNAGVHVYSLTIGAGGSGDDRKDVRVIYLALDRDGDGEYGQDDTTLVYQSYPRDGGMVNFEIPGGIDVPVSGSRSFIFAYDMKNGSIGSTYYFDVSMISAADLTGSQAVSPTGLPIRSSMLTISGVPAITSIPTTSISTTTVWVSECESDSDCPVARCDDRKISTYSCRMDIRKGVNVCAAAIASVDCCGDGDCGEGFYCLNYDCTEEKVGGSGFNMDFILIGVSIIVVIAFAVGVFMILKNRSRKPWESKDEYEKIWESLREKWKGATKPKDEPTA